MCDQNEVEKLRELVAKREDLIDHITRQLNKKDNLVELLKKHMKDLNGVIEAITEGNEEYLKGASGSDTSIGFNALANAVGISRITLHRLCLKEYKSNWSKMTKLQRTELVEKLL